MQMIHMSELSSFSGKDQEKREWTKKTLTLDNMTDKSVDEKNKCPEEKKGLGDWMKSMFSHEDDLKKEYALELCQKHLHGEWLSATAQDIDFTVIA